MGGAEYEILPQLIPSLVERRASLYVSLHQGALGLEAIQDLLGLLRRAFPTVLRASKSSVGDYRAAPQQWQIDTSLYAEDVIATFLSPPTLQEKALRQTLRPRLRAQL